LKSGEHQFTPLAATPTINGLTNAMLTRNPNSLNSKNGTGMVNPFRLDRSQAATTDQNHNYGPEQSAFHAGMTDLFPASVGTAGPPPVPALAETQTSTTGINMGYYDGNSVTALWNYAQRFAMSDNSYDTNFGDHFVLMADWWNAQSVKAEVSGGSGYLASPARPVNLHVMECVPHGPAARPARNVGIGRTHRDVVPALQNQLISRFDAERRGL